MSSKLQCKYNNAALRGRYGSFVEIQVMSVYKIVVVTQAFYLQLRF